MVPGGVAEEERKAVEEARGAGVAVRGAQGRRRQDSARQREELHDSLLYYPL